MDNNYIELVAMFVFVINNFNDRLIDLIYFHLQFIGWQE